MTRTKQVNSENRAVLNRDFPRQDRSLIIVPKELKRLYPNAKPEHIEMALERISDMSTTANIYSHLDAVTKADTGAAMSKALG